MYKAIPAPDLVVHLTAPLDLTIKRNAGRDKIEDEAFVRTRHALSERIEFTTAPVALVGHRSLPRGCRARRQECDLGRVCSR